MVQTDGYSELSFRVPQYYADKLSGFLAQLDQAKDLLGVKSYGISVPKLEDVFFAVKEEVDAENKEDLLNSSAEFKFPTKRRTRKAIAGQANSKMVVFDQAGIEDSEIAKDKTFSNMLPYEDEELATVSSKKVVGTSKSFMEDFRGVLYKRAIIYQKEPKRFFQQSLLPCVLFTLGFYICQGAYQ